MEHEADTPNQVQTPEQKWSQYEVYLLATQKGEGPKDPE